MTNFPHITRRGIPAIDRVAGGMHVCPLCSDRDPLAPALAPYSFAALRGDERCLCNTAPPLPACEFDRAPRAAWDEVDAAVRIDALRILRWFWRKVT